MNYKSIKSLILNIYIFLKVIVMLNNYIYMLQTTHVILNSKVVPKIQPIELI